MPTFNDSEAKTFAPAPEGDYIFCCTGLETKISNGQKTAGADKFELELELEPAGQRVFEALVDHASAAWKMDLFLKSAGVKIAKGAGWDFRKTVADANGWTWVNPIGLRGWCHVVIEEYTGRDGAKKKRNKVTVFYTDKAKLPPRVTSPEDEAPDWS